ncbi:hypothetical protein [Marinobacter sp. VGCF2001]|uniref:hypothetical protein n=1 Tax=Marinobacter sp. VGCF2001 TaxID=3417189 RepID=UPI003CF5DB01
MGMPLSRPNIVQASRLAHPDWIHHQREERVSISLDVGTLTQLMKNHHLHVEDFSGLDTPSKLQIRQLLLDLLNGV